MKSWKIRRTALILAAVLAGASLAGCSGQGPASLAQKRENVQKQAEKKATQATRLYEDSCGRQVEIPEQVESIVPSGSLAQMYLIALCPEKLVALSSNLSRTQKKYLGDIVGDLPVLGSYYGKGSTLNLEELIGAAPDLVIDIGEYKDSIVADMDSLTKISKSPAIFLQGDIHSEAEAFRTLGSLLDCQDRAGQIADYVDEILEDIDKKAAGIPEKDRLRVMYADSDSGQDVKSADSIHAEILEMIGAQNVAQVYTDGEVSMEQILLWDPDVIILSPDANYDEVFDDPSWAGLTAVKEKRVYEVPYAPYNWIDKPPSMQRILGIQWLAQVVYPDVYQYDMVDRAQTFFDLFYGYRLSREEAEEMMQYSLYQ